MSGGGLLVVGCRLGENKHTTGSSECYIGATLIEKDFSKKECVLRGAELCVDSCLVGVNN